MTRRRREKAQSELIRSALIGMAARLTPQRQIENPVMFLVWLASVVVTGLWLGSLAGVYAESTVFTGLTAFVLWVTVLIAAFSESYAESGAKARAESLKTVKESVRAVRIAESDLSDAGPETAGQAVTSENLRRGDLILVRQGEIIAADGEVVKGIASVNESAVTGESAPVVRGEGTDASAVTAGTTVLSDWIIVRVANDPGEAFIDRIIGMVESAERRKTPNEKALSVLLLVLTVIFVMATITLLPFTQYSAKAAGGGSVSHTVLLGLLVCLLPTTIGGLLSAVGAAGMTRLMKKNVVARSGRAVEAAGDVDILFLDKTGTITFGDRRAEAVFPAEGVTREEALQAAYYASAADPTPEGRSLASFAAGKLGRSLKVLPDEAAFIPFSAQSRMSGVSFSGATYRKGAADAVEAFLAAGGKTVPADLTGRADVVSGRGSTALIVCTAEKALAVVELKDTVKPGIAAQFAQLRRMGIRTVMITGDSTLTAATIASEAGVDDFLAEATPEKKLAKVRELQDAGHMVAMTGDGTNDSPALAQANVGLAMNSGTTAAKEAANMVDLDSSPAKLIDIVRIGKQMLMTRGALTTFSLANDIGKYFAVIPAAFMGIYPGLQVMNVMGLTNPQTALLATVIFNALSMAALMPLALKGIRYRPMSAQRLFRRNLLIYGLGGLVSPFIVIKAADWLLAFTGLGA